MCQHYGRSAEPGFPDEMRPYVDSLVFTFRLSPLVAALFPGQVRRVDAQVKARQANAAVFRQALAGCDLVELPQYADGFEPSYDMLTMNFRPEQAGIRRDTFCRALGAEGVGVFPYVPEPINRWRRLEWRRYAGPMPLWMDGAAACAHCVRDAEAPQRRLQGGARPRDGLEPLLPSGRRRHEAHGARLPQGAGQPGRTAGLGDRAGREDVPTPTVRSSVRPSGPRPRTGAEAAMTSRDLVRAAIAHRETPRVPYCIGYTAEGAQELQRLIGADRSAEEFTDNDVVRVGPPWWGWHQLGSDWAGPATPTSPDRVRGGGSYEAFFDQLKRLHDADRQVHPGHDLRLPLREGLLLRAASRTSWPTWPATRRSRGGCWPRSSRRTWSCWRTSWPARRSTACCWAATGARRWTC